jgi:two-component system sensor histidine kinase KdpD
MDDGPRARAGNAARLAAGITVALAGSAGATLLGRFFHANTTTMGFVFLVVVLLVAVRFGLVASTVASLAATACYNFFFLPPVGTFTIADPANWVALATFLLASVVVSRLVTRAQRRAEDADARRAEIEALYDLSIDLFTATNRVGALGEAAGKALKTLGARAGGLVLFRNEARADIVGVMGENALQPDDPLVETVGRRGETAEVPAEGGARDVYLPVAVGGKISGVLVVRGTRADRNALESVGRLLALAVERERFLRERTHLDALRESDALKTSLLRAVSHDLRTPMTAIRMGLEALRRGGSDDSDLRETLDVVARETERLSRRIDNLLAMARLDAGTFVPHPEPTPAADLFRRATESFRLVLEGRPLEIHVDPDCPDLFVDPVLALEILANFLENAARAAPPDRPLELRAEPSPLDASRIWLEVLDRGPGVSTAIKSKAAGRPSSGEDSGRGGLGLEICRTLSSAVGGNVALLDRPGGGTIARVDLPASTPTTP